MSKNLLKITTILATLALLPLTASADPMMGQDPATYSPQPSDNEMSTTITKKSSVKIDKQKQVQRKVERKVERKHPIAANNQVKQGKPNH